MTVPIAQVSATVRYLPRRSPNGPMASWTVPWATAYAVTTTAAAPMAVWNSAAICGKSESVTRTCAWLAKPATASSMMARVGDLRGSAAVVAVVNEAGTLTL